MKIVTAWRFGASGYVYYEIGKDLMPTGDSDLFLLEPGKGTYEELSIGDKLQAGSWVHFRESPTTASRARFVLQRGDCVVVLKADKPFAVTDALSGGWVYVATTACGLFQ
ncbi:hypothetical protein [Mycoplana rhizolycopersici]|uniref:Uncharacterized protein n=1 Tax=Mycoplana rhizolycopersici TaxID=2746702 RepID=A0ABX2QED9_9HYPH|nr:hypothetical protein [Rhizobium rhizolycopersici]NVP56055.1 hypothetical protein [Rhizobium rhizolycopersici]